MFFEIFLRNSEKFFRIFQIYEINTINGRQMSEVLSHAERASDIFAYPALIFEKNIQQFNIIVRLNNINSKTTHYTKCRGMEAFIIGVGGFAVNNKPCLGKSGFCKHGI